MFVGKFSNASTDVKNIWNTLFLLNNNHISKIKDRAFNGKPNLLKVDLSNNKIRDLTLSALSVETSNTASIKGKPCL